MALKSKLIIFLHYCLLLFIGYIANIIQALWSMWKFRNNQSAASAGTPFATDLIFGYGALYTAITGIILIATAKLKINKLSTHSIIVVIQMSVFFWVDTLIFEDRYASWSTFDACSIILETLYLSAIPLTVCTAITIWPGHLILKKIKGNHNQTSIKLK